MLRDNGCSFIMLGKKVSREENGHLLRQRTLPKKAKRRSDVFYLIYCGRARLENGVERLIMATVDKHLNINKHT